MFPLKTRKLIRGCAAHKAAGLGCGADYVANYVPLYAPFDGTVERVHSGTEGGKWLWLKVGSDSIQFAHLSAYNVKQGDTVKEGQLLATTGNTGTITTGPHLHCQILRNSVRLDPEAYNWGNDQGGEDMTNEEAKLLIYKATTGHEPQGAERTFALGPITPGDLAELRFRDDVIGSIWKGGLSSGAPDSEKTFWSTYFREHVDKHISVLGDQWRKDHVDSVINPLKAQLTTANVKIKTLTLELTDALAGYKTKLLAKLKAFIDAV